MIEPASANVPITRIKSEPEGNGGVSRPTWNRHTAYRDERAPWKRTEARAAQVRKSRPKKRRCIWLGKVYAYTDGSAEVICTPRRVDEGTEVKPLPPTRREQREAKAQDATKPVVSKASADRAARRAKSAVRRLVRHHNLRVLQTYTNGAAGVGWKNRAEALEDVSRFLKVYGPAVWGGGVPFVLVAERGGKGNRWHVHAATQDVGFVDWDLIRYFWTAFLIRRGHDVNPESGSIWHRWHCGDEQGRFKGTAKHARHIASYMAKYVGKSLQDDHGAEGEHRYRSWNAPAPVADRWKAKSYPILRTLLGLDEEATLSFDPATGKEWWSRTGMRPLTLDGIFVGYWGDLDWVERPPDWMRTVDLIEQITQPVLICG